METIHIAVAANERYMIGALVACAGVAVHAREETPLHFHVFTEDVKDETFAFTKRTLERLHANSVVEQHACDEKILSGLPYWAGSRMASVRCFFPYILKDVDWCLYLDCDVLYLASVEEHFSYRKPEAYAVVVQEEYAPTRRSELAWAKAACGVDISDAEYFNSGVMIFNFAKCRADKTPETIQRFFVEHPDVELPDQTAMNVVFHGKTAMAPQKFDRLQILMNRKKLAENPVIHYVAGNPWVNKFGTVANGRFRLWHRFADKYIWQREGESYRRSFSRNVLVAKYISYYLLKTPIVSSVFCHALAMIGNKGAAKNWKWRQIGNDI